MSPSTPRCDSCSARRPTDFGHADERVGEDHALFVGAGDLDERRDRFDDGVEDLLDDARELGIGADRRAEQQPERRAVTDRETEVGAEPELDPFATRRGAARRFGEQREQLPPGVFEELDVERPLAREVLVQHRLRDAGRLGDLVHRGCVEALLREAVARDVEELLAALIGGQAHRSYDTLDLSGMT